MYIDSVMCLLYEATPIPEAKLPPVYVRKERKRHKTDPSGACPPPRPGVTMSRDHCTGSRVAAVLLPLPGGGVHRPICYVSHVHVSPFPARQFVR